MNAFRALFVISIVVSSAAVGTGDKVSLELYSETLCPYCSNFIVNYLYKLFDSGLPSFTDMKLIPYGNAKIAADGTIKCQHGANECLLNIVEACAIDVWPDVNVHFPFVYCVESLVYHHNYTYWETCFEKLGLDASPVADCYQSGHGTQLELKYAEETNLLQPPHEYVPWVVVDGQPLYDDYTDVISYICNAYKGSSLPSICEEPSRIKLKINLLSGIRRLKSNLIQSEHRGSNSGK